MKIQVMVGGAVIGIAENENDVRLLLSASSKNSVEKVPVEEVSYKRKYSRRHGRSQCPTCGKSFLNLKIHNMRRHQGYNWRSNPKKNDPTGRIGLPEGAIKPQVHFS